MTGDFTSVPLRETESWTAARMQQGRVLLDTDWNLTVDAAARELRTLARDVVGAAGVPVGSSAFRVTFVAGQLTIGAGTMWVGGMPVRNGADLHYFDQPEIPDLPASGLAELYLDAFVEEVQAAEAPDDLLDPALDGVDTTTRQRVGWRVRAAATTSSTCGQAALPPPLSTGTLDVTRTASAVAADPCAPPDDPRSRLPDGLLRIEVIDAGTAQTARFAWSYSNGSDAVAATVAGSSVTLVPSASVTFAVGDLVEVSTLARRADRRDHGPLVAVADVTPQPGGDLVVLASASTLTGSPPGTCLRRWDGQAVGAAAGVAATLGGDDVGVAFTARAGTYQVGDWWGVRVRGSAADAVETRAGSPADGSRHVTAPLAVVDLDVGAVVTDCRRTFPPLVDLRGGTCTVIAFPGDDLQAALDALPADGGTLCLAAGTYPVDVPLTVTAKRRVLVQGVGPATVIAGSRHEAVLVATGCDDLAVTRLRIESARPARGGSPPGDEHLLGALTVLGGEGLRVHDCQVRCPDSDGPAQSGIYVGPDPEGRRPTWVEVRGNRLEIGDQQVGILVSSAQVTTIADNTVQLAAPPKDVVRVNRRAARELGDYVSRHLLDEQETGGRRLTLRDGRERRVGGPVELRRLATEWARNASERRLVGGSDRRSLARYVEARAAQPDEALMGATSAEFLATTLADARSVGQGIVVAGDRATRVRIDGNHVIGALQGIHVGLQDEGTRALVAGQVVVDGNTVESLVPYFWGRQRHAIYVGNVDRLTLTDNHAQLVRASGAKEGTPVDAVRVWGLLGPWVEIRGVDLSGPFRTGVVIRDTTPGRPNRTSLWYVSDVLNGGGVALDVPGSVLTDRCLP